MSTGPIAGPEQTFCAFCDGGNPTVARYCMWCGRRLPALRTGPDSVSAYSSPPGSSTPTGLPASALSPAEYRALKGLGLCLLALGLALSVGLALVAIDGLLAPTPNSYVLGARSNDHISLAAVAMAGLLATCVLLVMPGYILVNLNRETEVQ